MMARRFIIAVLCAQAICAIAVVANLLSSVFHLQSRPIPWQLHELLEIGGAVGLVLGLFLGVIAFHQAGRVRAEAEERLRIVSAAFQDLLEERFRQWDLTPAEADVAMFAIKGLTIHEIAYFRRTSEGTVKAQTNAIYRKAGVASRPQFLGLIIEELVEGRPPEPVGFARAG